MGLGTRGGSRSTNHQRWLQNHLPSGGSAAFQTLNDRLDGQFGHSGYVLSNGAEFDERKPGDPAVVETDRSERASTQNGMRVP
jgi:hypothetical protein